MHDCMCSSTSQGESKVHRGHIWTALSLSWTFFAQILQGTLGWLILQIRVVSVYYNMILGVKSDIGNLYKHN